MDIDKVPVIGKINRTLNILMINFVLLGIVCLILGITIIFFPMVLEVLFASLLIFAALVFFNIAYHVNSSKKKYTKWFE